MTRREFWIESGKLRLEGALHEGGEAFSAVVLHPHPQHGGDMDNHVVLSIAETLAAVGGTVLRFNFRGAGKSDGEYDDGRGEADDARAAVAPVRALLPAAPFVLMGYSFGAMIAAAVAPTAVPAALILVSPPLAYATFAALPEQIPTLAVTGGRDSVSRAAAIRSLSGAHLRTLVLPGADHGWWPGAEDLAHEVGGFVESVVHGHSDPYGSLPI